MGNYNKHTWQEEEVIAAEKLNNMEQGIANAHKEKTAEEYAKYNVVVRETLPLQELEDTQSPDTPGKPGGILHQIPCLVVGETYFVYWNGVLYECLAVKNPIYDNAMMGNISLLNEDYDDNGMPFAFISNIGSDTGSIAWKALPSDTGYVARIYKIESASKLPAVTEADNGKIVQVVDGKYAVVSVAESSVAEYITQQINTALGS